MGATATIYARQSADPKQDRLAVTRQLELCRAECARRGWEVAAELIDNDRSATSGAERPAFEALLASSPERIVVWHIDRLCRLTSDLERVIQLGVNVHALEAGHVDLSNPAGRATARTVTAWAQYETEQKALRQRTANDQRAAAGEPYRCQRAFGYEPDGMVIREPEAAELRAAAAGVLRGETLSSLVRDLNGREVRTATGRPWTVPSLKAALLSPRNAGLRRHRGEVVGAASWPAILDPDTAAAVGAVLTDPSRRRLGPTRRYLLSGVMRCGTCGAPLSGAWIKAKGYSAYRCLGHVSRRVDAVDEYVTGVVVARLSAPDAVGLFARPGVDEARLGELRAEQDALHGRLGGLAEAFAGGEIDRAQLQAGTARARARLDELATELAAAITDPTAAELASAADVAAAWADLPVERQRAVVGALLDVELLPVGSGRRTFDPARGLRLTWRS